MRKSVVSGPSTKFHKAHSAKAFAVVEGAIPERGVHDLDPAKDLLERPRKSTGTVVQFESPVGRAAHQSPTEIAKVHAPTARVDSPPRSPQSVKLEGERAARLLPGGQPPEEAPERVMQASDQGLVFIQGDVAHGSTIALQVQSKRAFLPERLRIDLEPTGMVAVPPRWQILRLTIGTVECLREDLMNAGGVAASEIAEDTFEFPPCPAGTAVVLWARNDSGWPTHLHAVLLGLMAEEDASEVALSRGLMVSRK